MGATVILALGATLFHFFLQGGWCGFYNGGPTDEQRHYCESVVRETNWGITVASMPGALLAIGAVAATMARSGRVAAARWIAALVIAGIVFFTIPFIVVPLL